jgi:hypothetical protein
MNYDPRWLRPAQRGRFGVLPLHPRHQPTPEEMAFDKVELWVPGSLHSALSDAPNAFAVLDSYRETLFHRSGQSGSGWTPPGKSKSVVRTQSKGSGTVSNVTVRARWEDAPHVLSVALTINPTRTLAQALSRIDPDCSALDALDRLSVDQFFARDPHTAAEVATGTLDGAENSFDHLDTIIARLGHDAHASFMTVFERQIRKWVLEAVAPEYYGFVHDTSGEVLTATNDEHRIELDWSRTAVRYAEVYCERRHGDAVGLMDRLASTVLAAHREADWRTYPIGEMGGRDACSTTIGIKPTSNIEQVYYAKRADRIRIETRYNKRVRDNVRGAQTSPRSPLRETLQLLQADACVRIKWSSFCTMAEDPPTLLISDLSRLAGVIARGAFEARVDPEPLFNALFGSGGIDEGQATSDFPRRLIKRLCVAGVINGANLQRRSRPGQTRRYHLREPYLGVALALQSTFGSAVSTDANHS